MNDDWVHISERQYEQRWFDDVESMNEDQTTEQIYEEMDWEERNDGDNWIGLMGSCKRKRN